MEWSAGLGKQPQTPDVLTPRYSAQRRSDSQSDDGCLYVTAQTMPNGLTYLLLATGFAMESVDPE